MEDERQVRKFALPVALVIARLMVAGSLSHFFLRTFFSMWVHESGHAVASWFCGYAAFPLPWFTPRAENRSAVVALALAGALGWKLWRSIADEAWVIAGLCGFGLVLQFIGTLLLGPQTASAMVIFWGDGGAMVLGTLLMATFYVGEENPLRTRGLRWGFLMIGAAAYTDVFEQWWASQGDIDRIPFGQIEGVGDSDPTRLTELYGWTVPHMIHRYVALGSVCLLVLLGLYAWGLWGQWGGSTTKIRPPSESAT